MKAYAKFGLLILLLLVGLVQGGELLELHQQLNPTPDTPAGGEVERVGLERLRCFAGCADYTVIFSADGSFTYDGRYGVERMGRHTGTVSVGRLNQLIAYLEAVDFMALDVSYSDNFLDGPTVYTMMEKGGEIHVVENYANNGPATLWAAEQLLDGLLRDAQWNASTQER